MKVLLEYIPLILFFIFYKLDERLVSLAGFDFTIGGIYSATAMLMISTVILFGYTYLKEGSLSRMQWIVVFAVLIFGSSTLLLRSEAILKWKAPAVNFLIGAIFLGSQFFAKNNMSKSMFSHLVTMPEERWTKLNLGWALTFFIVGGTNLFVAFTFHEWWVDFKVFGSLGMLFIAMVAQIVYIYPYMEDEEESANENGDVS